MTDIVERLCDPSKGSPRWQDTMFEAANEIERLRAALRGLLADTQHAEHDCGDADCPVALARAALGQTLCLGRT